METLQKNVVSASLWDLKNPFLHLPLVLSKNGVGRLLHIRKARNRTKPWRSRARWWKAVPIWLTRVSLVSQSSSLHKTGVLQGSLKQIKWLLGKSLERTLWFLPPQRSEDSKIRDSWLLSSYPFTSQWSTECLPSKSQHVERRKPPEWHWVGFGCLPIADVLEKFRRNLVQIQSRDSCLWVRCTHPSSSSLPLKVILFCTEDRCISVTHTHMHTRTCKHTHAHVCMEAKGLSSHSSSAIYLVFKSWSFIDGIR